MSQGLAVASIPLISRVYSPQDYSIWAIFISFAGLFSTIASFRLELAILLPKKDLVAKHILLFCLLSIAVMSPIAGLFAYFGESISGLDDYYSAFGIWSGLAVAGLVFGMALFQTFSSWFLRMKKFKILAYLGITQVFLLVSTQLLIGLQGHLKTGLVLGSLLSYLFVSLIAAVIIWKNFSEILREPTDLKDLKSTLHQYQNYFRYMTPYTLVGVVRERFSIFLFSTLASAQILGLFSLASRLVNLPASFAISVLRPIVFQRASSSGVEANQELVTTLQSSLFFVCLPIVSFFAFFSEPILVFVLGKHWAEAAPFASILVFPAFLLLLTGWIDRLFDVIGKQDAAFRLEVIFSILSIALLSVGYLVHKDIKLALIWQSVGLSSYYLYWNVKIARLCKFNTQRTLRGTWVFLFASVLSSGLFYFVSLSPVGLWISCPILIIWYLVAWKKLKTDLAVLRLN